MWAIRLVLLPLACHAWQLSLLHVNDIHARMEETNEHSSPCNAKDTAAEKCFGGLARLVTAVNQVKKKDEVGRRSEGWRGTVAGWE
jgi:2',3'-cyclic-nucleotide 2'-phosphodiesterase (5'-nucleotidase family)